MPLSDLIYNFNDDGALLAWKPAPHHDLEDRYDWEAFYLEIIRLAHSRHGAAFSALELEDYMRRWCLVTWRCCPSEALLQGKLGPVALRLGARDAGNGSGTA
jgi:hypothetical protein